MTFRCRGQGRDNIYANISHSNIEWNAKLQFKISRFEALPKQKRANLDAYIAIMICHL